MNKKDHTQLIVAADVDGLGELQQLMDALGDAVDWFKVGNQLFTRCGREAVDLLKNAGKKVFLDLKYHDIPNTVGQAVRSAAALGADMTNVHASGGPSMLRAAAQAAREEGVLVVAVTVLTSLTADELETVGLQVEPAEQVRRLACLARNCGIEGVVCSAHEIHTIRMACGEDFILVVPGIRPADSARNDQKRVMTPRQAARAGANFIVVGRPITRAENPAEAARSILQELVADTGA